MPTENDPKQPRPGDDQGTQQGGKHEKKQKQPMPLSQYYSKNRDEDPYYKSQPPPKVPYSHAPPKPLTPNAGYVPPPPPTPEQRNKDTVSMLYFFIVTASVVLGSCGLFSSVGLTGDRPHYSYENIELRVNRLYMTGYDPLMTTRARTEWIEGNGKPERFEIEQVGRASIGITVTVLVERAGEIELDVVEFHTDGEIFTCRQNYGNYLDEYTFTEAVQEVDPSVYPKTVSEIPEAYTK